MTRLYNKPIQNLNKTERKAYSSGQNKGIVAGISMIPIGRGISAGASIISKAPALAKAVRAFTNAPKQYLSLASKGINVGDKAKKISAVRDLASSTTSKMSRSGGFRDPSGKIVGGAVRETSKVVNTRPLIVNNKTVTNLPKLSEVKNLDKFLGKF